MAYPTGNMSSVPPASQQFGAPIPADEKHAVSSEHPTFGECIALLEGDDSLGDKIGASYPRVFIHPIIQELETKILATHGNPGERCMIFPSEKVAAEFEAFINAENTRVFHFSTRLPAQFAISHVYAVMYPAGDEEAARAFWKLTGQGISSRRAEYLLDFGFDPASTQSVPLNPMLEQEAKTGIVTRLGKLYGVQPTNVYLYPSGMAAVLGALKLFMTLTNAAKQGFSCALFGYAFKDTPKLLQKWGPGCKWYPDGSEEDLDELEKYLQSHRISGLFLELPTNVALKSPNLERIKALSIKYNFLVCIDDTIGYLVNVDVRGYADVIVSSLTKVFNGSCNVLAGSLVISPKGAHLGLVEPAQKELYEDILWAQDAIVLEETSRDVVERAQVTNANGSAIAQFFRGLDQVESVNYPFGSPTQKFYDLVKRPEGGYGGLMNVSFKDPKVAEKFYDNLKLHKGPSLGTNFTLAFPFVLVAHWSEPEFIEKHNFNKTSIRISVGLEPIELLTNEFKRALTI